jgi:hypothetical protein
LIHAQSSAAPSRASGAALKRFLIQEEYICEQEKSDSFVPVRSAAGSSDRLRRRK